MLRSRCVALALALGILPSVGESCDVRDFLADPLFVQGDRSFISLALEIAYPGLTVDDAAGLVKLPGSDLPIGADNDRTAKARLAEPSIKEMFAQVYPLSFDLSARTKPWFDPGRARNDALMRALYGESEKQVAASLVRVRYQRTKTNFAANTRQCVAQQLDAALAAIADAGPGMDVFFNKVGGSFNWRIIAGTTRLSAHSFGIAVDVNTELGGYWRWSGAQEGNVGPYNNQVPEALVHHMERHGFIWGGKWHHFDGMHFEYRPELIVYSRLLDGDT